MRGDQIVLVAAPIARARDIVQFSPSDLVGVIEHDDLQAALEAFLRTRQRTENLLCAFKIIEMAPRPADDGGRCPAFDDVFERIAREIDLTGLVDHEKRWNRVAVLAEQENTVERE